MTRYNWIGIALFSALFASGFLGHDNAALFFNQVGLIVVLSGTLGAIFMSYPSSSIAASLKVAQNAFTQPMTTPKEIVDALLDLSVRSRRKGLIALEDAEEETSVTFLKRALGMLVDGYDADEIRDILYTEMHYFSERRAQHERFFRHAARLAPAFGVAGSVIGLIAMLSGIGDADVIIESIPVALTSTLYGIVFGNFFLTPVAENIYARTRRELMLQKLATDGVMAIQSEQNPVRLASKLESFLTPSARAGTEHSFEEIRRRVRELQVEG